MRTVFADTGYWIAVVDKRQDLHAKAMAVSEALRPFRIVTSQMVLVELLNSKRIPRPAALSLVDEMREDSNTTVVEQTGELFSEALDLYRRYKDKSWSLTDCSSFVIARKLGITEALAHDRDFKDFGLRCLLRSDG